MNVIPQAVKDGFVGLTKPIVFGGLIAVTACYFGLGTTGGTEGVGQSTTRTVGTSSIRVVDPEFETPITHGWAISYQRRVFKQTLFEVA